MSKPLDYRPEIDGLRAFAVLAVVIFHLDRHWLPGGYLGVDVFFVISGFLITSIILKDCRAGNFSFREFYLRRARRILPALLTLLAATCAACYFILFPDEMMAAASACKRALLCVANYHFAAGNGYFDPSVESNPFLHIWSLSVEEQFYFIFPLLIFFAHGRGWLKAPHVGLLVILGFLLSCILTHLYPVRAFYVLESRSWQLAAGGWLAIAESRGSLPAWLKQRGMAILSTILLCGSMVFLKSGPFTPAPLAAIPVIGTLLFLACRAGGDGSWVQRAATIPPIRYIGRISYALYLIHWPLIIFYRALYGDITPQDATIIGISSLLLAAALHHLIENPLRRNRKTAALLAGITGATAILLFGASHVSDKKGMVNPAMTTALDVITANFPSPDQLVSDDKKSVRIGDLQAEPTIALWGDSHAQSLVIALASELKSRGICCEVWTDAGNLPALGMMVNDKDGKDLQLKEQAVTAISRPSIKKIIIASRWSSYLKGKPEELNDLPRITGARTSAEAQDLLRKSLDTTFARLQAPGREILIVYPIPEVGVHVSYLMARKIKSGQNVENLSLSKPITSYPSRHDLTLQVLDEVSAKYAILQVFPEKILARNGALPISQGKFALYFDDDHLSPLGSIPLVKEILETFNH